MCETAKRHLTVKIIENGFSKFNTPALTANKILGVTADTSLYLFPILIIEQFETYIFDVCFKILSSVLFSRLTFHGIHCTMIILYIIHRVQLFLQSLQIITLLIKINIYCLFLKSEVIIRIFGIVKWLQLGRPYSQ